MAKVVFVVGNICAGKSTCIAALKAIKPNLTVYSIDDLRVECQATNWEDDANIWKFIGDSILIDGNNKTKFVECSGTGRSFNGLVQRLSATGIVMKFVKINVSQQVARERFFGRPQKGIFLENKLNINESINNIGMKLLGVRADFQIDGNRDVELVKKDFLRIFGI